ncbi:Na(+) dependent transporter,Sodium Bile acid symporter family [Mariniradius saccharolyticus AK6]|uniref:Na(+) dependent transporter,Sodium Bile acid symporter family n=1 Tax=Mariniradius saccharolyticus AK6 TaxID=1239962 RepID=M7XBK1_9BACT|nr:bile acid:sodium symporter family protein [Mariniradius saccharolyticus]EMS31973.1 Na(+) dependent transporter,Sodium Bile acid symporter family [Mariniradius saccharolyticus AK6]
MQESILTSVFLPLALAFIMLGMGLSLTIKDFKNIFIYPKAMFLGLFNQMILLPVFGYALVQLFGLTGALAVGVMIIAACPGGATSNLITHLSRGDLALSISLTAFSSFLTIFTIPLIVNFAIAHFGEAGSVSLPVFETIVQIAGVTVIPVSIGMLLHYRFPKLSKKADKPVRIASAVFFVLILLAAIVKERANIIDYFIISGPLTLLLNLLTMTVGFFLAGTFLLSNRQRITIAIESGIQNGTLGIMIAATLLKNSEMTIPIAIYSLIMFMTSAVVVFLANRNKGLIEA